jgi:hypothetical protein
MTDTCRSRLATAADNWWWNVLENGPPSGWP